MLRDLSSIVNNRTMSSYMIQVAVFYFNRVELASSRPKLHCVQACVRKRVFVFEANAVSADGVGFVASLHKCSQCRKILSTLRHECVVCLHTSLRLSSEYL